MRTIGVVTVARSDYGIYLPVLRRIQAAPELRLHLIVSGMHLSPEFGETVQVIENDGFEIGERVEMLLSSDTPQGIAKSMGVGTMGLAQSLARFRPDILLVLGDRFEMFAAALAALPFKIPVAHIHGGEVTRGAMDDALRHAMTKLSHLHFVTTREYGRRVIQLGEEPWRVTVCGAPGLDHLRSIKLWSLSEIAGHHGLRLEQAPLLVTFHPVTLEYEKTEKQVTELLAALHEFPLPMVFTLPNADTHGRIIRKLIQEFIERQPQASMVENLGSQGYLSLMAAAAAMVGNSSSGLIEAPSFKLPVVNIGIRQEGRVKAANVLDVAPSRQEITAGINKALQPDFRKSLDDLKNPYGDGHAADKIVTRLQDVPLNDHLTIKRFYDLQGDGTL